MSEIDVAQRLKEDADYLLLLVDDRHECAVSNGDKGIVLSSLAMFTSGLERQAADTIDSLNTQLSAAIAERDAARAGKTPTGCIIDDQGCVRRVLGTLPRTADGCVIGHGVVIHCNVTTRDGHAPGCFQSSMTECDDFSAEPFDGRNWFSTREAAEAAQAPTPTPPAGEGRQS